MSIKNMQSLVVTLVIASGISACPSNKHSLGRSQATDECNHGTSRGKDIIFDAKLGIHGQFAYVEDMSDRFTNPG